MGSSSDASARAAPGLRLSKLRTRIVQALVQHGGRPTLEELRLQLKEDGVRAARSTVVKALQAALQAGVVAKLHLHGQLPRYEATTTLKHGHLIVPSSGVVSSFPLEEHLPS